MDPRDHAIQCQHVENDQRKNQTILREMRRQDRPQALVLLQKAISKAVRAEKRDRVEKLPVRAEEGKGAGATRIIYRTINSLAPKQQGARETVWDAEGRAYFGEAEELDTRAQALMSIMAAEEQIETDASAMENMRTRQTQAISIHKFSEKQVCKLMTAGRALD